MSGDVVTGEEGYRGPTACSAAGITYRQLDYWARTGLVEPSVRPAHGSGSQRLYSFRDILVLKVVKRLLDTGISLQQIRAAVQHLRDRGSDDLAHTRARLLALSPASTLRRGYAIVQHQDNGVVRSAAEAEPGETLSVRFAADQLTVHADG